MYKTMQWVFWTNVLSVHLEVVQRLKNAEGRTQNVEMGNKFNFFQAIISFAFRTAYFCKLKVIC